MKTIKKLEKERQRNNNDFDNSKDKGDRIACIDYENKLLTEIQILKEVLELIDEWEIETTECSCGGNSGVNIRNGKIFCKDCEEGNKDKNYLKLKTKIQEK